MDILEVMGEFLSEKDLSKAEGQIKSSDKMLVIRHEDLSAAAKEAAEKIVSR